MSELKYCKHGIMKHMECHICQYESKIERLLEEKDSWQRVARKLEEEKRKLIEGLQWYAYASCNEFEFDMGERARTLLKEVEE